MVWGVLGFVIVGTIVLLFGILAFFGKYYQRVEQGRALIINKAGEPLVSFTTAFVLPLFHRAEHMDISVKTIEIDRRGKEGLICQDNIRADIKVTFFVRVNKTREDVLKVAGAIGCARASHQETLEVLFIAKFSEALKTVGKRMDFVNLYTHRDDFKDQIISVIGRDLNGYVLEDAAIDFLEQTPLDSLDRDNILDAQGIRKITELTAVQHVQANVARRDEEKLIKIKDVETAEAILEQDKRQAEAVAKQRREIASIQAREAAEVARVQAEEKQRAENARLKAEESIKVQNENTQRQIEVANKNRQRVVGIEEERVQKDRMLEAIARERATELERIAKEKALEVERKEIADVIRQRIEVEKAVAAEEEAIKELRMVEEARRTRDAIVIAAEAEAQEAKVKAVTEAEAAELSARHKAAETVQLAQAALEAADKQAQAKIRLAEAVQATEAAAGLAAAKVKLADANAHEKHGLAEAKVTFEKLKAEAEGKQVSASAVEDFGTAEANVVTQKGTAEAHAIDAKLKAEAAGLAEKAKSMKALDEAGRGHEEFRLQLEKEKVVELEEIRVEREIAEAQARVMGEAFKTANIDIIGGDGQFFDKLMNAASLGKATDRFVQESDTASTLLQEYFDGERSLPSDLKAVLSRPAIGAQDVQHLTLAAFLGRLATGAGDDDKEKLDELLKAARSLGLTEKTA